jgi:drug/metabolite transporter (DMT)-like permease
MAGSILPIAFVIGATLIGDYFLKSALQKSESLLSLNVGLGVTAYGLVAIGWFYVLKSNTLALASVIYSAATVITLSALGYFVFKEQFGMREALGVSLAVLSVVVMNPK